MRYKVKLNIFEGPFDLLVYLIENARMNVYDINVSEITSQYLEYLDKMKKTDVAMAADFMVLAASLIEIKSKMLLPRIGSDNDSFLEEDPREELVERILEYKRFKHAAELLEMQEAAMARIFPKPQEDLSRYLDAPDEYLSLEINQFVNAFNAFLHKKRKLEYIKKNYAKMERQKMTIESKIQRIWDFFKAENKDCANFNELLEGERSRYNKVITFVSLLEMVRQKSVNLKQKVPFGDILVSSQEKGALANDK